MVVPYVMVPCISLHVGKAWRDDAVLPASADNALQNSPFLMHNCT